MKIKSIAAILVIASTTIFAGDNSQASFADIKEAVYKLILQNKEHSNKTVKLDSRLAVIEDNYNQKIASSNKKDTLDAYIEKFVESNKSNIDFKK